MQISGKVSDLHEEDVLLFKRLDFSTETLLDTLPVDEEGRFKYTLKRE